MFNLKKHSAVLVSKCLFLQWELNCLWVSALLVNFQSNIILNPNVWNSLTILTGKYWKNGFSHWEMELNNWQLGLKTGKCNWFFWLLAFLSKWSYLKSPSQMWTRRRQTVLTGNKFYLYLSLILNVQCFCYWSSLVLRSSIKQ